MQYRFEFYSEVRPELVERRLREAGQQERVACGVAAQGLQEMVGTPCPRYAAYLGNEALVRIERLPGTKAAAIAGAIRSIRPAVPTVVLSQVLYPVALAGATACLPGSADRVVAEVALASLHEAERQGIDLTQQVRLATSLVNALGASLRGWLTRITSQGRVSPSMRLGAYKEALYQCVRCPLVSNPPLET